MLYIVATPIGNMGDTTLRAIETLKACDFVIAENPHYSRRLMDYIERLGVIASPNAAEGEKPQQNNENLQSGALPQDDTKEKPRKEMVQFAEHNEQRVLKDLVRRLQKENGCLITDAGTPGISDPGFRLVRECVKEGIEVVPIPGANAAIAALSASGLPTDRFLFLGFLQKTANKTVEALQTAKDAEATAVFYESPERITKTMSYIANAFPDSHVVAAREITKLHEEFIRGTPYEVINSLKDRASIKGEFTVLISFK